jgi:hypothetical protein
MLHLDKDQLLAHLLATNCEAEYSSIELHLTECQACRKSFNELERITRSLKQHLPPPEWNDEEFPLLKNEYSKSRVSENLKQQAAVIPEKQIKFIPVVYRRWLAVAAVFAICLLGSYRFLPFELANSQNIRGWVRPLAPSSGIVFYESTLDVLAVNKL